MVLKEIIAGQNGFSDMLTLLGNLHPGANTVSTMAPFYRLTSSVTVSIRPPLPLKRRYDGKLVGIQDVNSSLGILVWSCPPRGTPRTCAPRLCINVFFTKVVMQCSVKRIQFFNSNPKYIIIIIVHLSSYGSDPETIGSQIFRSLSIKAAEISFQSTKRFFNFGYSFCDF